MFASTMLSFLAHFKFLFIFINLLFKFGVVNMYISLCIAFGTVQGYCCNLNHNSGTIYIYIYC